MAQQERAIRTRRAVLMAAAEVFAKQGYTAATVADILKAAGVTKGALYFHFDSKEALAQGVLEAQGLQELPEQDTKLQEMIDVAMTVAHRLVFDPVVQAGARLSADPIGRRHYGSAWPMWVDVLTEIVTVARQRGETLPHVVPREIAELVVSAFNGVQLYAQLETDFQDIERRVSVLLKHLLPSIALPSVLLHLDIAPDRGSRVLAGLGPAPDVTGGSLTDDPALVAG
ncbi:ScbR family autoregulator-binding transcription factor [Streptomyces griseoviridis]|jgi:AcrR family transcriptional regulator|uniref:AcrR family transcriptional regulator n=2 Tax=Streptomyces griseoviridis TaxID=45398 RepID=R9USK2_STRGD|nr:MULTISPECIES: ScbR family autoregulator-binding transcription factor [Streptomyces]AGN74906.1 gamma-butyrolactone receptor [Streptomyces griseoviridis]MDP9685671.1 AcrR family transcriptional regulator [Streptomyces griseoviridis]GGS31329.1 gamma-butyrolactone-binding protein [Streptomyces niveoruber]GGS89140.1 gamma-butyrolactone-binding protein [Streptomyces griseoviridis]